MEDAVFFTISNSRQIKNDMNYSKHRELCPTTAQSVPASTAKDEILTVTLRHETSQRLKMSSLTYPCRWRISFMCLVEYS